ncbi:FAD-dependent monooxygenase [Streptomyces sp. NPDC090127]|uniref:FAD-dependent monooxygenase n=1 Tax=Streptomyces sp. NPDC090127 TaxID=3365953 RepID=UPI0038284B29
MTHRNVLIAGAGFAGPALAHFLGRHGMQATVVERAPSPREDGPIVDLRGAGLDVARKMGLERTLRAHATREEGIRFVDAANRTKAAFASGAYVLAGELAHHAHHGNAFARYEHVLRPYVTRAQQLPPGVPHIASPRTRAGIHALNTVLRAASRPRIAKALNRFLVPPADTFTLPPNGL